MIIFCKTLAANTLLTYLPLILKIFCSLLGVTFQTELVIMTFLDAVHSLCDWSLPFDWAAQIDQVWKTTMSRKEIDGNYHQYIKFALSWVVVSRMVIAHLYTITYAANFYAILTWCHGKILIPWLMLSAFKNFFLESIVILVVILLYIEGDLSGFLFISIMVDKLISFGISAHNWLVINSFYVELDKFNCEKKSTIYPKSSLPLTQNLIIGMPIQNPVLNDNIIDHSFFNTLNKFISLPNLKYLDTDLSSRLDIEFDNELYTSVSITSMSINHEVDEQSNESYGKLDDNLNLIKTHKETTKIIGSTLNNIDTNSAKITPEKILWKFNPSIESMLSNKNYNSDNHLICKCSTLNTTELDDNDTKVESDENSLCKNDKKKFDETENDRRNDSDDDSEWINMWSMKRLLKNEKFESNEYYELDIPTPIISDNSDNLLNWSSEKESNNNNNNLIEDATEQNNMNDSKKILPDITFSRIKHIDYYNQSDKSWIEYLRIVGSSFETTLQSKQNSDLGNIFNEYNSDQLSDKQINKIKIKRSWILDGMSIEIFENDPLYSVEKQKNVSMKSKINSSNMKGMDTIVTSPVKVDSDSSIKLKKNSNTKTATYEKYGTQISPLAKLTPKHSYYTLLSINNLSNKLNRIYESIGEREANELKALKMYNAKTLWKDKQKRDIDKFKLLYGKAINLSGMVHPLKSKIHSQLFKQVQLYQGNNINVAKKTLKNLKIHSLAYKTVSVTQINRYLNPFKANENIYNRCREKTQSKLMSINETALKSSNNKFSPIIDSPNPLNVLENYNIKNKIAQLDWSLSFWEINVIYHKSFDKSSFNSEPTMLDIIDENDTADLLQSAFSFDSRNTRRGFYLGPASTDHYSLSEQIPNVFQEIIKATTLRTVCHDSYNSSTGEIDYGDIYYEELSSIDSNSEVFTDLEKLNCANSKNDTEIFNIDYWIKKLRKVILNNNGNSHGLRTFEKLKQMPELLILRQLINNLCNSLMISVSTATSRLSIALEQSEITPTAAINNSIE